MALHLQGEVVDEWWIGLLPGDNLGVDYVDDEVSHERLALWPLSDRSATWMVRSPDGDEWAFPRGGLRPRWRRRLRAFRARLVDEPLRAAILRAREQVIQMGGDGAYRPVRVVRSDGSTLQKCIPDLFREVAQDGGCKTWNPSVCC